MTTALAHDAPHDLRPYSPPPSQIGFALPPVEFITERVKRVQLVMKDIMVKDEHYGTIPGTKEPCLWKAGAELLCMAFGLSPRFKTVFTELPGGHISVETHCELLAMGSNVLVAEYVAVCSTLEDKYRFRNSQGEPTGKPVPEGYWEARKVNDKTAMEKALGGKSFFAKKNAENKWEIYKRDGQMVENDNPGALRHTMVAMSIKRALVGATRIATASSNLFAQDIDDDMIDDPGLAADAKPATKSGPATKPAETKPAETPRSGPARPAKPAFDPSKMLAAFQAMGVAPHQLVAKVGRTVPDWTDADQQFARDLYARLKSGETTVAAEWPPVDPAVAEVCAAIRESAKKLVAADLAPRVQSAFKGAGCECSEADLEKQPKTKLDILARMLSDAVAQIPEKPAEPTPEQATVQAAW